MIYFQTLYTMVQLNMVVLIIFFGPFDILNVVHATPTVQINISNIMAGVDVCDVMVLCDTRNGVDIQYTEHDIPHPITVRYLYRNPILIKFFRDL